MAPIYLYLDGESTGATRVDRFPAPPRAILSVAQHTADFVGTVTLEASLTNDPTDDDWFVLHIEDYAEFVGSEEKSRNRTFNLTGRFIWMRVTATPQEGRARGSVDRVMVI